MKTNTKPTWKRKKYRVSEDILDNLMDILDSSYEQYFIKRNGNDVHIITTISSNRFHKLVLRARCEKRSEETGVFYMTLAEASDPAVSEALLSRAGKDSYCIIDWDTASNAMKEAYASE